MPTPQIDPQTGERVPLSGNQIDPATGERATVAPSPQILPPASKPGVLDPQDTGHPVMDFAKNTGRRALSGLLSPVTGAMDAFKNPTPEKGLGMLNSSMDFLSPGSNDVQRSLDNAKSGHPYSNLAGDAVALGGGALMGKGLESVPTRAGAGELFQSVMRDAGDQPVNLTRASEPLLRTQELAQRGTSMPQAAGKLLRRATDPDQGPLTYKEARDFASNLSRLSSVEAQRLNPMMKMTVGKLSNAFNQDVGDAASSVGRGEDYAKAMKDYASASKLRNGLMTAGKIALPTAIGGGLLGSLVRKLTQ